MKLSPHQQEAVERLKEHGRLIHWPGGYWVTPGTKEHPILKGRPKGWSTDTNTVMALFRKGLIQIEAVLIGEGEGLTRRQREAVELMKRRGGKFIRWPWIRKENGRLVSWSEGAWAVPDAKTIEYIPGEPDPVPEESVDFPMIWGLLHRRVIRIQAVWKGGGG